MNAEEKQEFIRDLIDCVRESATTITIFADDLDATGISYTVVDSDLLIAKLQELI